LNKFNGQRIADQRVSNEPVGTTGAAPLIAVLAGACVVAGGAADAVAC
jgi:hypothetical protein